MTRYNVRQANRLFRTVDSDLDLAAFSATLAPGEVVWGMRDLTPASKPAPVSYAQGRANLRRTGRCCSRYSYSQGCPLHGDH